MQAPFEFFYVFPSIAFTTGGVKAGTSPPRVMDFGRWGIVVSEDFDADITLECRIRPVAGSVSNEIQVGTISMALANRVRGSLLFQDTLDAAGKRLSVLPGQQISVASTGTDTTAVGRGCLFFDLSPRGMHKDYERSGYFDRLHDFTPPDPNP